MVAGNGEASNEERLDDHDKWIAKHGDKHEHDAR